MPEVYATPRDPQKTILDLIRPVIVAAYPGTHVGAVLPQTFTHAVTVRSDGGPMVDQVQTEARLGINVWAPDEAACFQLAALVENTLLGLVDGSEVLGVTSVSGPVPVAEPTRSASHIYMTFEAVLAGS